MQHFTRLHAGIMESVDSICRDSADMQRMCMMTQKNLSKSQKW